MLEDAANHLRYATSLRAVLKTVANTGTGSIDSIWALRGGYRRTVAHAFPGSSDVHLFTATPQRCVNVTIAQNGTRASEYPCEFVSALPLLAAFFNLSSGRFLNVADWDLARLTHPLFRSVRYVGREHWNEEWYDVVEWKYEGAYTQPQDTIVYTTRTYIAHDGTARRTVTTNTKQPKRIEETRVCDLTLDVPLSPVDFPWPVPTGVPVQSVQQKTWVGQKLPALTAPAQLLDGPRVTAEQLLSGKKGTILWWWHTRCSGCIAEMPVFEQLYGELKDRGINVVAVDLNKEADEVSRARENRWYNRTTMPVLLDADAWETPLLDVKGPMLVDRHGTVVLDGQRAADMVRLRAAAERLADTPY